MRRLESDDVENPSLLHGIPMGHQGQDDFLNLSGCSNEFSEESLSKT